VKTAVILILAVLLLTFGSAGGAQNSDAPQVVSVAVTTAAVRESRFTRTDALLLWNRNQRTTPIGHAIKACLKTGGGAIFGKGVMTCTLVVSLPLGKVTASGIVHNLGRYTLVITGGTGAYRGATGPLFVRSVSGNGVRRLTFSF
jgi:hypothetical protein